MSSNPHHPKALTSHTHKKPAKRRRPATDEDQARADPSEPANPPPAKQEDDKAGREKILQSFSEAVLSKALAGAIFESESANALSAGPSSSEKEQSQQDFKQTLATDDILAEAFLDQRPSHQATWSQQKEHPDTAIEVTELLPSTQETTPPTPVPPTYLDPASSTPQVNTPNFHFTPAESPQTPPRPSPTWSSISSTMQNRSNTFLRPLLTRWLHVRLCTYAASRLLRLHHHNQVQLARERAEQEREYWSTRINLMQLLGMHEIEREEVLELMPGAGPILEGLLARDVREVAGEAQRVMVGVEEGLRGVKEVEERFAGAMDGWDEDTVRMEVRWLREKLGEMDG